MKENKYCLSEVNSIVINFTEYCSHADVIEQFVNKLSRAKFAPKKEIIEHLKMVDLLLK